MFGCGPYWVSDYHFTDALRFHLFDEVPPLAAATPLLLWDGVDAEGEPFLNLVIVIDAPPALPDSTGMTGSPDGPPAERRSFLSGSP